MSDYRLLMSIVRRDQSETYITFFKKRGIDAQYVSLCRGTASKSILDYLGIEKTDKTLLQAFVPASAAAKLLRRLVDSMGIEVPGNGIAMTIPVNSIGGRSSLNYLTQGQNTTIEEVRNVSEINFSLIVAITDKGNTDLVMDAARSAGARGGTVLNARGTAPGNVTKFFGMSIGEEKEIVYIVAKKADKESIMREIMNQAGMHTEAKTVLFSLPVDGLVGLGSLTEEE